jgi:transcriptional regulator with XRE-family HTH domain
VVSDKQKNPLPKILGERFKAAREEHGLSIKELANQAILSNSQIRQIEGNEQGAFYSPIIKYSSAQKVAKILGLPEDQAFDTNEVDLEHDSQEMRELKEIEAMLAQKMINELQYERPSLIQKIIGKQTSAPLPLQGVEVPQDSRSKSIFKRSTFLLLLIVGLAVCYWLLNPYLSFFKANNNAQYDNARLFRKIE